MKLHIPRLPALAAAFILLFPPNSYPGKGLSLQEALGLARKNEPFYQAEKHNLAVSATDIVTAGLRPNLSFSFSYQQVVSGSGMEPGTGFFDPANRMVLYQVGKTLQVHDQRKLKIGQAKAASERTGTELAEFERNLMNDVAMKWLDTWYAGVRTDLVRRARLNADTILKVNGVKLKNQVITTTEFSRIMILQEQYELKEEIARQELLNNLRELAYFTGKNDSIIIDDAGLMLNAPADNLFDTIMNYAFLHRTDLLAGYSQAGEARAGISLQQALAFPQPEVGINYNPQNGVPYLGAYLGISLPVFDRNQGQIARARELLDQANSRVSAIKAKLGTELRTAWTGYLSAKAVYTRYGSIYSRSEEVLHSVLLSYIKGGTTILDYLEAERSWFEVQSDYYGAVYEYRRSYINLLFVSNMIEKI